MADSIVGGIFWSHGSSGCFVWARVLDNGRIYGIADMEFSQKPVEVVASEIKQRSYELEAFRIRTIYADPDMFPSKDKRVAFEAETPSQTFARYGLPMIASGSNREHGWQRVHDYLRMAPDGKPWLILSPECVSLIRTMRTLIQKKNHPDDCEGEDYAANALRAIVSARPVPLTMTPKKTQYAWGTVGWLRGDDAATGKRSVLAR